MQVSFDGGKSFRTIDRLAGPTAGNSHYVTFSQIPPGTRAALVRFAGTGAKRHLPLRLPHRRRLPGADGGFAPLGDLRLGRGEPKAPTFTLPPRPSETFAIDSTPVARIGDMVVERADIKGRDGSS